MIKKAVLVAAIAVAAVTTFAGARAVESQGGHRSEAAAASVPVSAATSSLVSQLAEVVNQRTGVTPSSADVYQTTRSIANEVVDAGLDGFSGSDAVSVVVFTGNFTDNSARIPRGGVAPAGTTITFVVDSSTGKSTDYGIGPAPSDLAQMGAAQTVPVSASSTSP